VQRRRCTGIGLADLPLLGLCLSSHERCATCIPACGLAALTLRHRPAVEVGETGVPLGLVTGRQYWLRSPLHPACSTVHDRHTGVTHLKTHQ